MDHLQQLEAESIWIFREAAAQFQRPVLLFSGGKDSILMVMLAQKAFYPGRIPFPLIHIDTGHNFSETLVYRDQLVKQVDGDLRTYFVEDSIKTGRVIEETGPNASRNTLQTTTLLDALSELEADAAFGGGRRDEEKARAKERIFSLRDEFGQWDPKNQRPELWQLYNGSIRPGQHMRIFPISNWTELDVWQYIERENIPLPSLYFSHQRKVIHKKQSLIAVSPFTEAVGSEKITTEWVRCRTIGDITCTGLVPSVAENLSQIISEVAQSVITERGFRSDDRRSDYAMEERKRQGYF